MSSEPEAAGVAATGSRGTSLAVHEAPARSPEATIDWGEPRRKEITWYDPLVTTAAVSKMTGLESLQAIRDGLIPNGPIGYTLD